MTNARPPSRGDNVHREIRSLSRVAISFVAKVARRPNVQVVIEINRLIDSDAFKPTKCLCTYYL